MGEMRRNEPKEPEWAGASSWGMGRTSFFYFDFLLKMMTFRFNVI